MSSKESSTRVDIKNVTPLKSSPNDGDASKDTLDNRNNHSPEDKSFKKGAIITKGLPFPSQSKKSKYDVGADTNDLPDLKSGYSTPGESGLKTKSIFKSRGNSLELKF